MLLCYCVVCCAIVFDVLLCVVGLMGCWFVMLLCCWFGVFCNVGMILCCWLCWIVCLVVLLCCWLFGLLVWLSCCLMCRSVGFVFVVLL